jgi:hypothetical protein
MHSLCSYIVLWALPALCAVSLITLLRKHDSGQPLVAHVCSPSYSGGRDQEDSGSRQPGQIVLNTLPQKPLHKNRAGGMTQGIGPEFKTQYVKKERKHDSPILNLSV